MKLCVAGAGAMGCLIGGLLAESGNEVWLVARSADHIRALSERGLSLRHGGSARTIRVNATSDPVEAGICDAVLVMTKCHGTRPAIAQALPIVGTETAIVTLQNGLGNVEQLSAFVDPAQILFGVTTLGAVRTAPGAIEVTGLADAKTFLWSTEDRLTPGLARFVDAMVEAGLEAVAAPDVKEMIWRKLCLTAGVSALAAVIGLRAGDLSELEPARAVIGNLIGEIVAVAAKEEIELDSATVYREAIDECVRFARHAPSILVDVASGRQTEVGSVSGAVVDAGARHGIPTPYNHAVASILSAIEQSYDRRFSIEGATPRLQPGTRR